MSLIYIYEIRNFAVCLVSGNKSMGYHVLANISDKKAVYISKFLNTDLIELKYNDGLIFIYGTTTKFQSIKFKDSKK